MLSKLGMKYRYIFKSRGAFEFDLHLDVLMFLWSLVTFYEQHGVLAEDEHYYYPNT